MSELIFGDLKSGYVLFEENIVCELCQWHQVPGEAEAGGILIGYRRPPHLHVVSITLPMKRDRRSASGFWRTDPKHSTIARRWWNNSSRTAYYLGEWHTHPQDHPAPSILDKWEWKKLLKSNVATDILFLIVGRKSWYLRRKYKVLSCSNQEFT